MEDNLVGAKIEIEDEEDTFKEQLLTMYRSRAFQIGMDLCRVLLVILMIFIAFTLVKNIESVKVLNNDPCEVCMNKTGANCFIGSGQSKETVKLPNSSEIKRILDSAIPST